MQQNSYINRLTNFFQSVFSNPKPRQEANRNLISTPKKIYLTIDDSPSIHFESKMNYLVKKKIPAILFCIGQLMEKNEAIMIEAIQRGFPIANHSYTHPHFSEITLEQAQFEIEKTDQIIEQLYAKASVKRTQRWFRFPYGDKGDLNNGQVFNPKKKMDLHRKDFIQKVLRDLNYTQPNWQGVHYNYMKKAGLWDDLDAHWTFDIMEWATLEKKPTFGIHDLGRVLIRLNESQPLDCRGEIGDEKRWLESSSAEVVLLHDHEGTSQIFEEIVGRLMDLGVVFCDLSPGPSPAERGDTT